MPRLTAMDELFVHQIPEPLPNTVVHHPFWRESLFFVMHPPATLGDVVILTLAHFPAREEMDSLQLGRVGGAPTLGIHRRPYDGDPHTMSVGTVTIDIVEPYRTVRLRVDDGPNVPLTLDMTFTARTAAYGLRRGTMRAGHELIWDQSHMIQSGWYNGSFTHQGTTYAVEDWWGQRDHSWGIREHARCPLWIWLAVQLPEGMLAVWHWEYPNGARVYTDGCFAPAGGGEPVSVVDFRHDDLHWIDDTGEDVSYGQFGDDVSGLAGSVEFTLEGGRTIRLDAEGRWAQRYDAFSNRAPDSLGGGLNEMIVRSSDGSTGTAIYEVTGQFHHRYFPVQRGERLPPDGR
jgi:hypothetical protein